MLDIIQRYQPIVRLIRKNPPSDRKIVEVGGGGDGIGHYLKKYEVIDCDLAHAPTMPSNTKPIVIKNEKLPFANNYTHTVVCVDTLEHVSSKQKQKKLVSEMVRIAKKYIYLAVPTGEKSYAAHQKLKKHLERFYPKQENKYLEEHLRNGHPDTAEILALIKKAAPKASIATIPNANIYLWFFFQKIYLALPRLYHLLKYRDFWRKLLFPIWWLTNLKSTIRTIYVINLRPADDEY